MEQQQLAKKAVITLLDGLMAWVIGFLLTAGITALPFTPDWTLSPVGGGFVMATLYVMGRLYKWAEDER